MLIYCGAVGSEPDYFEGFRERNRQGTVTVTVCKEGTDPVRLVRRAAGYRDRRPGKFDEVWCVTDVDRFNVESDDCRAFCRDCAEVTHRLRKHVPAYDKTRLVFADFSAGVGDAVKRARELAPAGTEHRQNPSTSVWRLVERNLEGR